MRIKLKNIGKRYRQEWIFRGIDYTFEAGKKYAILGHNGSGKSTFTRILTGHLTPTKGKIKFTLNDQKVSVEDIYKYLSLAAPYVDVIEEFTLTEAINFHQKFKPFSPGVTQETILKLLNLNNAENKEIRNFSSGMKQRLKLALAICSDTPLLFLDEPTTNLDKQGTQWYRDLIQNYSKGKTVIIASNVTEDFDFCDAQIEITDFKKKKKKA